MKSPEDLALPWLDWRAGQRTAIRRVLNSKAKTVVVQAPTGSGKSAVALGVMRLDERRGILLTATKGLQDQYQHLAGGWLNDIRGMNNYGCFAAQDEFRDRYPSKAYAAKVTCDRGLCRINLQCTLKDRGCTYFDAYRNAVGRNWVSSSYAYYFASLLHGRGLGASARLIGDEGHSVEEQLALATQLRIPTSEVQGTVPTTIAKWRQWAENELAQLRVKVDAREAMEAKLHIKTREDRLQALRRLDEAWAVERTEQAFVFEPIDVRPLASVLHKAAGQVVLMSATITEHTTASLGLTDVEFVQLPMRFPLDRRPVYLLDGGRIDYRATPETLQWWLSRIDQIIGKRGDRKGIVHTVSYDRMRHIAEASAHRGRMIVVQSARDLPRALAKFKALPQASGAVLVAPNVVTGFDFPYTDCEYQVIVKVPFPNTRSPIAKARCASVPEYRERVTMQTLVQAIGRGMRAEDDACECVSPDTRVLTADLRWVPAGLCSEGDELLAFDEFGRGRGHSRQWQKARVVKAQTSAMPRMLVEYEGGSLTCTPNHPWIVMRKGQRTHDWRRTDELTGTMSLAQFVTPWAEASTFDEGWLSGILDGEGCLVLRSGTRNPHVTGIWIAQNKGVVLDRVQELLKAQGIRFTVDRRAGTHRAVKILGGLPQHLEVLGRFRPARLLNKFLASSQQMALRNVRHRQVIRVTRLSDGPITSLQTSSKTYIAEGFGAHNTFIVDEHARWFMKPGSVASKYAPSYVLDAVVVTNRLPTPPSRLVDPRGLGV